MVLRHDRRYESGAGRNQYFSWPPNLKQGDYLVWLDQAPIKGPSLTAEQLAGLKGLTLAGYEHEGPLVFTTLPRLATAEIKVKFPPAQNKLGRRSQNYLSL